MRFSDLGIEKLSQREGGGDDGEKRRHVEAGWVVYHDLEVDRSECAESGD